MGLFFNPNNESFKKTINSNIYVDKTMIISELNSIINTENCHIAISHARRFGKSQVAGMIDAYYSKGSNSSELFLKYQVSKTLDFNTHLNKYNVIHLDMSSITDGHLADFEDYILMLLYDEMEIEHFNVINRNKSLSVNIGEVYKKTNSKFVIIIDEWDYIIRNCGNDKALVHKYLQFLHSILKSEESKSYIALAYITGIMPIKKIQNESALNNFKEYTMLNSKNLTQYFGFTIDEVKKLCDEYNMEFETIKQWYDGYYINSKHIYNPNSVVQAMQDHEVESYWKNTSSFETINKYIDYGFIGLKEDIINMLEGKKVPVNVLTFQNDLNIIRNKDEALTALIHLGYLAYDAKKEEVFIPNYEVANAFRAAILSGNWGKITDSIRRCQEILNATIDGDEVKVCEILEIAHENYTSIFKYNDENSLSCVITMAYFTAPAYYNVIRECPMGKGFADIAFIPRKDNLDKPAFIVELKYDKSANSALAQIKEKNYFGLLKDWENEIILVGVNYDKTSKKHACIIEKYKFN